MKNAITGGMSEQETRATLRKRGVKAFMVLAGSLPQKEPDLSKFDDLPTFSVVSYWQLYEHDTIDTVQMWSMWLKCDESMCCDCADALEITIQHSVNIMQVRWVRIFPHCNNETCVFCGNVCRDEIPF